MISNRQLKLLCSVTLTKKAKSNTVMERIERVLILVVFNINAMKNKEYITDFLYSRLFVKRVC